MLALVLAMALQGCPNEGADHRALGWLICPLQRLCSWKSAALPRLWTWGAPPKRASALGLWPPYLVVNIPRTCGLPTHDGHVIGWRLFRAGWRYDRTYRGFIGPSAAFKKVSAPLIWY